MDRSDLLNTFKDDASIFIERLNNTLLHLEKDPGNLNLVHQAFRFVHSIKSEASYLQLTDITKASHNMETMLDIIRKEKREIDREDMRNLYSCVDELQEKFSRITAEEGDMSPVDMERKQGAVNGEGDTGIGEQEKSLLIEARERGEILYRLTCEIDSSELMKKSRAFLLINNLELIVNVISVQPALDEERDDIFKTCTVIFTSDGDEGTIYDAVHVDQIHKIQISRLEYDSFLALPSHITTEKGADSRREDGFYRVSSVTLDEAFDYMDQLKLTVLRLSGRVAGGNGEGGGSPGVECSDIRTLTDNLESLLKDIRKVRLSSHFSRFGRLVRDLADDLGKKVEFDARFGDLSLDRNTADLLSEILGHFLRNAVDHGIEPPAERLEAGKPEYGIIEIEAEQRDGRIRVSVRDDGRGISEELVRIEAQSSGLVEDSSGVSLLDILTLPGFSTRKEVTDYSGRGVGLDVIQRKLEKISGAGMELKTAEGDGSVFIVTVPMAYNPLELLLVRAGEETLAMPMKNIRDRMSVRAEGFGSDDKGFLTYDGEGVYGTGGRLFADSRLPDEPYGLAIQYLGARGILLVDELLFEKEIPENSLELRKEIRPHVYSLGDEAGDTGYLFLSPSIISADL